MAGLGPAIHETPLCQPDEENGQRLGLFHDEQAVGVTDNSIRRVWEHREGVVYGFTKRYGLKRLVYFEAYDDIRDARQWERNIKHYARAWKVRLILLNNPTWNDLYDSIA